MMDASFVDVLDIGGVKVTVEYHARYKRYHIKIPKDGVFNHDFWFGRKNGEEVYKLLKVLASKVPKSKNFANDEDGGEKRARLLKWAIEHFKECGGNED